MTKKIIMCFDGIYNEPEDSKQESQWWRLGQIEDYSITNVFKLHLLLGGNLSENQPGSFPQQESFYYSGVGANGSLLRRAFNVLLAPENLDVASLINQALRDLESRYESGDEVFLFGFSRGSAIARRFAAVLPERFSGDIIPQIRFMGLFDTVTTMSVPNLNEHDNPIADVVFENLTIAPIVQQALHLVSLDERRKAFIPTLINRDERVSEIWFSGVHLDIGGGYRYDGLSDQTLQFMLDELIRRDLGLEVLAPSMIDYESLEVDESGLDLDLDDIAVQPDYLSRMHGQKCTPISSGATMADRFLRVYVDGTPSDDLPLIHHTVIDRIYEDIDYRPTSLRKRPHQVWISDSEEETYSGLREHLLQGKRIRRVLKAGESKEMTVYANQKYSRSGVFMQKGGEYYFRISGSESWRDGGIVCGPAGWDRASVALGMEELIIRFKEDERRCPEANWFEVVGALGKNEHNLLHILEFQDASHPYTANRSGEFFAFPNDLERFYFNNMGFITLTIHRIK